MYLRWQILQTVKLLYYIKTSGKQHLFEKKNGPIEIGRERIGYTVFDSAGINVLNRFLFILPLSFVKFWL